MARVSQHYRLGRTQATLEFVDVDTRDDTPLFIDAGAIRFVGTTMSAECASLIQSFFGTVLRSIHNGNHGMARDLLSTLNEPNETRLGLSAAKASGHGMGEGLAIKLWDSLRTSSAVASGVLSDLEETALFVEGIDRDVISDIITNIIRGPMIDFTQTMCRKYAIPMIPGIAMLVWDRQHTTWVSTTAELPVASGEPLLLVPRNFVRRGTGVFAADRYYRHFVIPYLQAKEFNAPNGLRRLLADGTARPPYKKTVMAKHPGPKPTNAQFTQENPALLDDYRSDAERNFKVADHEDLAGATGSDRPDFDALLQTVLDVAPGAEGATAYHHAVEQLLTALFYPALDQPVIESKTHEGRKRIDITYANIARTGFFNWLHAVHGTPCAFVPVECKNYRDRLNNPEFDQLTGRFSVQRGQVGMLCYRGFSDKADVLKRCRDAALDGRGFVVALDDDDLRQLVDERKSLQSGEEFAGLFERFRSLI